MSIGNADGPALGLVGLASSGRGAEFPAFRGQEIDPKVGNVCYAVTTADVDGDGKPDVVAVTEDAVVWFANPGWKKHTVIKGATARDNVCLQAHDIDGDGKVDFALGAGWKPTDTNGGGTLQWLRRPRRRRGAPWKVHPIGSEPTLHRIRWGDVRGTGKKQLVVAPLQGRGTKGPNWGEGAGVRVLVYTVPDDPAQQPLAGRGRRRLPAHDPQPPARRLRRRRPRRHPARRLGGGLRPLARPDGRWSKTKLGAGNQEAKPFKGASEIKVGRLADGGRYIATIEPWHGYQVVVYTPPSTGAGLWDRRVIDEPVAGGHAVWCADLDGDGDHELIIGPRDKGSDPSHGPGSRGLRPRRRSRSPWSSPATSSTTAASPSRTSSPPTSTATAAPRSSPAAAPRTTSRSTGTGAARPDKR